jgi:ABC-2 type transport system permease protein
VLRPDIIRMFCWRHSTVCSVMGVGSFIVSFALVALFPDQSADKAKQLTELYPKLLVDLIGDPMEFFSNIYGWIYAQFFHITFWVVYGLYAGDLATDIIAGDIEKKSIDIMLSYPVARSEIIVNRFIGLIILLACSTLAFVLGCCCGIAYTGQALNMLSLTLAALMSVLICLNFAAVTLLISVVVHRSMLSLGLTFCIFGFMFMYEGMLTKLIPALDRLSFMSPFHYYQPDDILIRQTYSMGNALMLSVTFIVLVFIGISVFRRKDILV